jgi:hypothetical protein
VTGAAQDAQHARMDDVDILLEEMRREVRGRGLATVARELRMALTTLGSVLVGASREGSRELALARWRERRAHQLEAHAG